MPTRLKLLLVIAALTAASEAHAIRILAGAGFGSSTSKRDASYSEGPFLQAYGVETDYDSRQVLGVEHIRSFSLSPMSTALSYSGVSYRYYFNGSPGPFNDLGGMQANSVEFRDWCLFTGGSFGLAQSTAPPEEGLQRGAAGVYVSPKVGVDLAMSKGWGVRGELIFNLMVFGAGGMQSMGLAGGVYFTL